MSDTNSRAVSVKNLKKSFADITNTPFIKLLKHDAKMIEVLKGLTFDVPKGKLLGVMGKNGAGKSTLLRLLGNVYPPTEGIITVNGNVASIFEMGMFIDTAATGRAYCKQYFNFFGKGAAEIDRLTREIKEFTELGDFFEKPIYTYSSGMQAKLLFAIATSLDAEIFLIDEVLVVGDAYFQGRAWRRLINMLKKGCSGVIVTHDWNSLLKLCEKSLLIRDGKIALNADSATVVREYLDLKETVSDDIIICDKDVLINSIYEYEPGEPFEFEIELEVKTPPTEGMLRVTFLLIQYISGETWRVALTCEDNPIPADKPGKIKVRLKIPVFELSPGDYYLTFAISSPLNDNMTFSKVYQSVDWFQGKTPLIRVKGEQRHNPLITRKLDWKIKSV